MRIDEGLMKILIVDDEPDFVSAIQMRLEANGYGVSTAEDGQQALQKIQFERPDLVILDIQMPDVDGYEVCQRLKADPKYRDIPILVLTARAQKDGWCRYLLDQALQCRPPSGEGRAAAFSPREDCLGDERD
jgi:CheY-like chemotaxis protein